MIEDIIALRYIPLGVWGSTSVVDGRTTEFSLPPWNPYTYTPGRLSELSTLVSTRTSRRICSYLRLAKTLLRTAGWLYLG